MNPLFASRFARFACSQALATGLLVASVPWVGHAQTAPTRQATPPQSGADIATLFRRATAAFDARDFETSLRLYQQAYIESEQPEFLVNIASALEQLQRLTDARAALRRYLDTAREVPNRDDVQEQIRALDARINAQHSQVTPPVTPPVVVRQPDPLPRPPPPARPVWPWITLAGGGALAIGGTLLMLTRPNPASCDSGAATPCLESEFLQRRDQANTMTGVGVGLLAAGGALVVTGIIGAIIGPGTASNESASNTRVARAAPRATATIAITSERATVEVFGAF